MPLSTALCKNLRAENTQRYLSRPKSTRVSVPIEEEEEEVKVITSVLLQLPVHQLCIRSISDCSKMQWSTKFMTRKILTSSSNIQYFECLITLEGLVINILESKCPESRSQWPLRLRPRLHWSQNRHNTTVWTDSRQGTKYQTHYCVCQRLH